MMRALVRAASSSLADAMADVLREAAEEAVMPRYRRLNTCDMEEKSPGEIVTTADRDAERLIARGLARLCPEARFVGEEACARSPGLIANLDHGTVWIVDPIDGTANYAAGKGPFAMMAALVWNGDLVAAAILDPVGGRIALAERGAGARIDGARLTPSRCPAQLQSAKGIISDFQRPPALARAVERLGASAREVVATRRCAGAEYPLIASGACGFALYWRTLVWDHAPGVLILEEAGGKAARLDGQPFRVSDRARSGIDQSGIDQGGGAILLAGSSGLWNQAAAALSG